MATKPPKNKPPTAKKRPAKTAVPKPSKPSPANALASRPAKTFTIEDWSNDGGGVKMVAYGGSGLGKTTLASTAPNPVYIGVDDGGRQIFHPLTGKRLRNVPQIEDFHDVRQALANPNFFPEGSTIVVDTLTKMQSWMQEYILQTVTANGKRVTSFRQFGWDGDRHMTDTMRLLLTDLDAHVAAGRNVLLLCQQGQIKVANAGGEDFLQDNPFLQHRGDCSCLDEVKQWADHVMRIGYLELQVAAATGKKGAGKVISDNATRAIFTDGAQHFAAKTRPIDNEKLPPVISFAHEADTSL